MNVTGMIDLTTCSKIIAESYQEYYIPLMVFLIIFLFVAVFMAILYLQEYREGRLLKDYLRRQNMLNKYEDWKKDREVR